MRMVVKKSRGLKGEIRMPGDKSITHRALILGAIAQGTTVVRGFLSAQDCLRTVEAFRRMGIEIRRDKDLLIIQGRGLYGLSEPKDVLDLGNSGTSLRLLTGLLSGQRFFSVLTGDDSLRRRPMRRVVDPLQQMGAEIYGKTGVRDQGPDDSRTRSGHWPLTSETYPPLAILGRPLKGIAYALPVASAQVKSALLLAGLYAEGQTAITEPVATRDHTERMFRVFGVDLSIHETTVRLSPPKRLEPSEVHVPGDLSSAAFFVVAALILPNSELVIRDVGVNPTRIGVLEILKQMGGAIRLENRRDISGEPVADLEVRSSLLKGIVIGPEWVPRTIDEFPILSVAAAFAEGETVIRGAGELRVKESDRIATMARELAQLGARVEELPDGLIIHGGQPLKGTTLSSHGDHRVAMALAVAGLAVSGITVISDTACIGTSFPGFERLLARVQIMESGDNLRPPKLIVAIDGPAGSGKSSAARLLAKKLGYLYIDTGALYRAVGWKALQEFTAHGAQFTVKESSVKALLSRLRLDAKLGPEGLKIRVDGQEVAKELRALKVSRMAAAVAAMPSVRKWLLPLQHRLGQEGGVVVEGRDIGTVVFPQADPKFFLTASTDIRIKRRFKELRKYGADVDLPTTRQEIDTRDLKDSRRTLAPLKQAEDAILIDSTDLSLKEVVRRMLIEVKKKWPMASGQRA